MDHEKLLEFNKLVSQTSDFCCNKLKYSNYTMKFYHKCWDKIYELMLKHNISVIDDDSVSILLKKIGYYKKGNRHVATNIYYLSRSLKMLLLYKKTNSVPLVLNDSQNDLLIPFSNYLKDFLIYLKLKQRRNNITISAYKRNIIDFLNYLSKKGLDMLENLDITYVLNYIRDITPKSGTTPFLAIGNIRGFLKFLHETNITSNDISAQMPRCKRILQPRLPSTYSILLDERGVTRSTIISYKNIMVQFLKYMNKTYNLNIDRIKLKDITFDKVKAYLQYLEKEKKVKTVTRNLHLSMLHSFFIYVQFEDVENSFEIQKILSIKMKKTFPTTINYLSIDAIKKILAKPDINTSIGRRNLAMLALLYDSGCRVQELIDLNVSSISFISPPTLKIIGKGRKIRMVPLIDKQIEIIKNYMKEYKLMNLERANEPLFFNSRGERFTRQNIAYILIKYANMVRKECPELIPEKISPHIFRHSKAMHLLQAGVNIVYIRDFMGHVSINTTEIYAKADSKMKREAIENAYVKLTDDKVPKWENNENLLSWLENL